MKVILYEIFQIFFKILKNVLNVYIILNDLKKIK